MCPAIPVYDAVLFLCLVSFIGAASVREFALAKCGSKGLFFPSNAEGVGLPLSL